MRESLEPRPSEERVFLSLAQRTSGGRSAKGASRERHDRFVSTSLVPLQISGRRLRGLCSEVQECEHVTIMWEIREVLAVFLPLEAGVGIQLYLQYGCDKWARRLAAHRF